MSCQAGLDAGFFYSGPGVAFDDLAAGDDISCQLFFISPAATSSTQLLSGTCDALGEVVANLNPVTKPYGDIAGAVVSAPVEASHSGFGLTLDELIATNHTIVVYNEDRNGQPILSCGDFGGTIDADGALTFALPAQGNSRYSGIGVITTSDYGGANNLVYMAPDLDGSDREVAGVSGAQQAEQGSLAGVDAGSCDGATLDDLTAELSPVTATDGDLVSADTPGLMEQSLSTIDLSLDDLVASDYVVAVFDEDAPDTALVCGPIGGILGPVAHTFDDSLTMAVGLPALRDSLYSGVAVLTTADDRSTEIAIYVAPDLDGSES